MSDRLRFVVAGCLFAALCVFVVFGVRDGMRRDREHCAAILGRARSSTDSILVLTSRRWSFCANVATPTTPAHD